MAVTPEIEADLMVQYRRTRSPFKAAKAVGISAAEAWAVIDKHKDDQFEERHGGRGRPELQEFIVATRRGSDRTWDNNDPAVREARRLFESGTHTLTTGRDGSTQILYCIPLRFPSPHHKNYFTSESYK